MTLVSAVFFFFNDTATTEIYTLSLHDALPISLPGYRLLGLPRDAGGRPGDHLPVDHRGDRARRPDLAVPGQDRKSTRLNSSHANISYAVFCLKKKNKSDTLLQQRSQSEHATVG